ncbi:type IV pilus biogenesis protein PilM [Oceanobacillus sp. Castelsardo]|uniref:type IV pilus biogenesis protein PilM n=1 Tax=Oceanobacillus sp. Castelsardo TaxID=1851204 RepID=UPI00083821D7|nr:pilus assembly protein PilM [Oceanobacillus sp. Castelsardo]
MSFLNKGRVNIAITNHVLRYAFHKSNTMNGLMEHGQIEIPQGTIQDGRLINKAVFTEVVNQLVHQHKWKRKNLFIAMPDDTVVIRQIQIPASLTKDEAKSYIYTQIGNQIYLPFSNPVIDIELLDTEEGKHHVLLYAYPKEKLTEYIDAFQNAGLNPTAADLTSLSIYRYYYKNKSDDKKHVLLIHWNNDSLSLTIIQEHKAVFTRHIKVNDISTDLEEESLMQYVNDYLIEINRIIDFYRYSITKGEYQINQLILSGDFLYLAKIKQLLFEMVEIPIENFERDELKATYVDVLGLALKKDV